MNILKYELLDLPYIGSNNKYNYFYKIICKTTNEYYYGIHVTDNIDDNYLGSGKLLNKRYKNYDIKLFTKFILKFFDNTDDVYEYEKQMITHEVIKDKLCLNCIPGGRIFESNLNKKHIHYNDKSILVSENLLQEYLDNGWELGRIIDITGSKNPSYGKVWISKNGIRKYVDKELLQDYLNEGWENKMNRCKKNDHSTYWVNNGTKNLKIQKHEIDTFISNGWKRGRCNYKRKEYKFVEYWINNGIINKRVKNEDIDSFISNGWKRGRCNMNINPKSLLNLTYNHTKNM